MTSTSELNKLWTPRIGTDAARQYTRAINIMSLAVLILVLDCVIMVIVVAATRIREVYFPFYVVTWLCMVRISVGVFQQRRARATASRSLGRRITWGNFPPRAEKPYLEWCEKNNLQPYEADGSSC